MPSSTLSAQVAALEAERDALKRYVDDQSKRIDLIAADHERRRQSIIGQYEADNALCNHRIPELVGERDAAIARAEAAEKRAKEIADDCAIRMDDRQKRLDAAERKLTEQDRCGNALYDERDAHNKTGDRLAACQLELLAERRAHAETKNHLRQIVDESNRNLSMYSAEQKAHAETRAKLEAELRAHEGTKHEGWDQRARWAAEFARLADAKTCPAANHRKPGVVERIGRAFDEKSAKVTGVSQRLTAGHRLEFVISFPSMEHAIEANAAAREIAWER